MVENKRHVIAIWNLSLYLRRGVVSFKGDLSSLNDSVLNIQTDKQKTVLLTYALIRLAKHKKPSELC